MQESGFKPQSLIHLKDGAIATGLPHKKIKIKAI
jgi:hypothetical protein